ncbi:MAG: beta strand repeat-containing protein [Acidimicrobiales bacterium]
MKRKQTQRSRWQRLTAGPLAAVLVLGTSLTAVLGFVAPAGASPVTAVQASISPTAPSSNVAGASTADYTVLFTVTTALPHTDTITVTFPTGTSFTAKTTYKLSSCSTTLTCAHITATYTLAISTAAHGRLVLKLPATATIPAANKVIVEVPGVTNPTKAGSYTLTVATTTDATAATSSPYTITAGPPVSIAVVPATVTGPASTSTNIGPYTVTLRDANNNPTHAKTTVTLDLHSTPAATMFFAATRNATSAAAQTTVTIPSTNVTGAPFWFAGTKVGTYSLTVTDPATNCSGTTTCKTSTPVTAKVTPGPAQNVALTPGGTQTTPAGIAPKTTSAPLTATFTDAFGNHVTSGTASFALTNTAGTAASLACATGCTDVAVNATGKATVKLSVKSTATSADTWTVQATLNTTSVSATDYYVAKVGPPTHLVFTPTPAATGTVTTKTGFTYTVQAETALGNPVPAAVFSVTFAASGTGVKAGTAGFGATATTSVGTALLTRTVTLKTGKATVYFGDRRPNTVSVTVTSTHCGTPATSKCTPAPVSSLALTAGPAATITLTSPTGTALPAGTAVTFTGTVKDALGNLLSGKSVKFSITNVGGATTCGTASATTCTTTTTATGAFTVKVHTATSSAATFSVKITSGTASFTKSYTLLAGAPTHLVFTPTPATTGTVSATTNVPYTVALKDANGNTVKGLTFTVDVSSTATGIAGFATSSGATPTAGPFAVTIAGATGTGSFYFSGEKAGTVTISAADSSTHCGGAGTAACTAAKAALKLLPGPADKYTVTPASGAVFHAGTPEAVTGVLEDQFGNPVAGTKVTLRIGGTGKGNTFTTAGGCTSDTTVCQVTTSTTGSFAVQILPSDYVATGNPFSLTETTTAGNAPTATQYYTLTGGVPVKLVFKNPPAKTQTVSGKAGIGFEVEAVDQYGNVNSSATFPVHFAASGATARDYGFSKTLNSTLGTTPAATLSTTLVGGTATVYFGDRHADKAVTVTASGAGCGTTGAVVCTPPATASLSFQAGPPAKVVTVSPTSPLKAGLTYPISATVQDAFGNPVSAGTTVTLDLVAATASATFSAPAPLCSGNTLCSVATTGTGGSLSGATMHVNGTEGHFTLRFSAGTTLSQAVRYTVGPGTPTHLVFLKTSLSATQSVSKTTDVGPLTVAVEDAFGNVVPESFAVSLSAPKATAGDFGISPSATTTIATAKAPVTAILHTGEASVYFGDRATDSTVVIDATGAGCGVAGATKCTQGVSKSFTFVAGQPASVVLTPASGSVFGAGTSQTFTATVRDALTNLVPTGSVTFTLGGTSKAAFTGCTTSTSCQVALNKTGKAAITFTVGTHAGIGDLTLGATDSPAGTSGTYTVKAGPPASISLVGGGATATTGKQIPAGTGPVRLTATVRDKYTNPVGGAAVTFTTGSYPDATLTGATCATKATSCTITTAATTGQATVTFTAGGHTGPVVVQAAVTGTTTTYTADTYFTVVPAAPTQLVVTPAIATGTASATANVPLTVTAEDQFGNPTTAGKTITVTFKATGPTKGEFSPTTVSLTGSKPFDFGATVAGTYTVVATSTSGCGRTGLQACSAQATPATVTVKASSLTGTYKLTVTSPTTLMTTTVDSAFPHALAAKVVDQFGNGVPNVKVTFTAPSKGASATFPGCGTGNVCTELTNATGVATTPVPLANTTANSNPYAVTITDEYNNLASGTPASFSLKNVPGSAYELLVTPTPKTSTATGKASTTANVKFSVQALDVYSNPVDPSQLPVTGITVTFSATSSAGVKFTPTGGKLTSATPTLAFLFGSTKAGTYHVSAQSTQCGPKSTAKCVAIAATATITAATAHSITAYSGGGQQKQVGEQFTAPLVAQVKDVNGNPVSTVNVTFTAPTKGASVTFGTGCTATLSTPTSCVVKTNATGLATSPLLTANHVASSSPYSVTASVVGVTAKASFSLSNTAGPVVGLAILSPTAKTGKLLTSGKASTTADIVGYRVVGVDQYGNRTTPAPGTTIHVTLSATAKAGFVTEFSPSATVKFTSITSAAYFSFGATGAGSYTIDAVSTDCGTTGTTACTPGNATVPATAPATVTPATAHSIGYVGGSAAKSGSGQKAESGANFTNPLQAVVVDQFGNPVPGVSVTFTGPSSTGTTKASVNFGGGATTKTVVTNGTGVASTGTFSANNKASSAPYLVDATATGPTGALKGSPLSYTLTNEPGKATYVAVTARGKTGDTTTGVADTHTDIGAYVVTLQDQNHNNITPSGPVSVTLSPTGTCGSLACGYSYNTPTLPFLTTPTTFTLSTTQPSQTVYFGAERAGTYTLSASAKTKTTTLSPVTATATVTAAAADQAVPTPKPAPPSTPQSTEVGTSYSNPLSISVSDKFGNPVSGASVVFSAPGTGATVTFAGTGCSGGTCTETTNGAGIAVTPNPPVANTVAGPVTVTATVHAGNDPSAAFSLTNLAGPAVILKYTTAPQTGPASSAPDLGPITVGLFDVYGNPAPIRKPTSAMTVVLSDNTYPGGKFSTLNGAPISSATITVGNSSTSFLFGSTTPGVAKITVTSSFPAVNQTETITTAAPSQVVFTTPALAGTVANTPDLGPATVELQDPYGNVVTPVAPVTVMLSSTSSGAVFGSSQNGKPVTSVTIGASQQTATFWYGDTVAGSPTVTASASVCGPKGSTACTSGTQTETLTAGPPAGLTITPPAGSGQTATSPGGQQPAMRGRIPMNATTYNGVRSYFANLGPFTVTLVDQFGNVATATSTVPVTLTSTSHTAKFSSSEGGPSVTTVTIPAGSSTATFWYGDFTTGTATITVFSSGLVIGTQLVNIVVTPTQGYWLEGADGGVFAFGTSMFFGSAGGIRLAAPLVAFQSTPDNLGYWQFGGDGGVITWGDAQFYGSMGGKHLNAPVVGAARTSDGGGYWEVASDGGVFSFGNATFYGSMGGKHLNAPVVGMAATPTGGGYWLVASDGGIFSFGNARFMGSMGGQALNAPIVGMAATPDGGGYWLVASDGGIFAFGDATFYGSAVGGGLGAPVVAMAVTPTGGGYWEAASNGSVAEFGDAKAEGTATKLTLKGPVVAIGGS